MSKIKTFKDLYVWQEAHALMLLIYKITTPFPKHELFSLVSQMRRSAASVPANIVEGFRRQSLKDSIHFYVIADASLEELKSHLLLSKDLEYVEEEMYIAVLQKSEQTGRLLTAWIKSQRSYL